MDKAKLLDIIQSYLNGEFKSDFTLSRAIDAFGRVQFDKGLRTGERNSDEYWQFKIRNGDYDG